MEDVQNGSPVSHLSKWAGGGARIENIGGKQNGIVKGKVDNELDFGTVVFESPVSSLGRLFLENFKGCEPEAVRGGGGGGKTRGMPTEGRGHQIEV